MDESYENQERDPFFIGWLPMPMSYAKFLWGFGIGIIVMIALASIFIANSPRSPGSAVWEDEPTILEGIVIAEPYPHLRIIGDNPDGPLRMVLLVEEGKFGASDRVRPFDGQPVRVRGTMLRRDDQRMMELLPGPNALVATSLSQDQLDRLKAVSKIPKGEVTLVGEIVDGKCFLGAMKPGTGKTHKGCAVLCLKGGIPPLFVAKEGSTLQFFWITDQLGKPLHDELLDFVADPVQAVGSVERYGTSNIFKLTKPLSIRRSN